MLQTLLHDGWLKERTRPGSLVRGESAEWKIVRFFAWAYSPRCLRMNATEDAKDVPPIAALHGGGVNGCGGILTGDMRRGEILRDDDDWRVSVSVRVANLGRPMAPL